MKSRATAVLWTPRRGSQWTKYCYQQTGIPKMNKASIQINSSMLKFSAASCLLSNERIDQFRQPEPSATYRRRRLLIVHWGFNPKQNWTCAQCFLVRKSSWCQCQKKKSECRHKSHAELKWPTVLVIFFFSFLIMRLAHTQMFLFWIKHKENK